ncbi:hypothetical protein [Tateyamaria sp. syn59]|uniref:hypothetical protein n=1 Tax=Tateyamaria sp. syn59 TaxID=2576942 RepID=UPI0011BDBC83|nr:hypothetical protein [Tateyamaria sp. syn59]
MEVVTSDTLRLLAKGEPDWHRGVISQEFQSMLVMVLPDICGELLALRAAARLDPARPATGADLDAMERIEGLTQHACDELAEANVRIATLEERTAEVLLYLKGRAT